MSIESLTKFPASKLAMTTHLNRMINQLREGHVQGHPGEGEEWFTWVLVDSAAGFNPFKGWYKTKTLTEGFKGVQHDMVIADFGAIPTNFDSYIINPAELVTASAKLQINQVLACLPVHEHTDKKPIFMPIMSAACTTVSVKGTSNATGGGKYNGRILLGSSTAIATTNLAMPEGLTVPAADDTLILNPAEDGLSTHALTTPFFASGIMIGSTAAGLKIVVLAGGGGSSGVPVPTAKFQVLQCSNFISSSNYTLLFDFVRAH